MTFKKFASTQFRDQPIEIDAQVTIGIITKMILKQFAATNNCDGLDQGNLCLGTISVDRYI